VSCDAEVGRWCSGKLYYLNVTFLNINKAFPYPKKKSEHELILNKLTEN
jgi:hypothetical protein